METTGTNVIRQCKHCGITTTTVEGLTIFRKVNTKLGYGNECKQCVNHKQREAWKDPNNPKKKHQLAKRYNTTPDDYVECMDTSDVCEICNSDKELCYDHDHNTMKFRGVLCRSCNKAIGALGDTVAGVRLALAYLVKHYNQNINRN